MAAVSLIEQIEVLKSLLDRLTSLLARLSIDDTGEVAVFKEFYLEAKDATVPVGKIWTCASGDEQAFKDLTIDGIFRNDGKVVVSVRTINNIFINNGIVEIGGYA